MWHRDSDIIIGSLVHNNRPECVQIFDYEISSAHICHRYWDIYIYTSFDYKITDKPVSRYLKI